MEAVDDVECLAVLFNISCWIWYPLKIQEIESNSEKTGHQTEQDINIILEDVQG